MISSEDSQTDGFKKPFKSATSIAKELNRFTSQDFYILLHFTKIELQYCFICV